MDIKIDENMSQEEADALVDNIINLRFENIIDPEDRSNFDSFLVSALENHGQYLFALTNSEGGICWFLMEEDGVEYCFVPETASDSVKPLDFQDIPVWYLNPAPSLN